MIRGIGYKTALVLAHDVVAAFLAWSAAFVLRFNLELPETHLATLARTLLVVVPTQAVVFWAFGLYRGMWRFASVKDLTRIGLGAAVAIMASALVLAMTHTLQGVPRSVLILDPLLLIVMMGGSRFAYRTWKEHRLSTRREQTREPVLIIGAGDAGAMLAKELTRSPEWKVVGFVDDNPGKHGRMLHGVPVLGNLSRLALIADAGAVTRVIIAMPSASHAVRRRIMDACNDAGLRAFTIPSIADLVGGRVTVTQIRPVELDDLLGRHPVKLDNEGMHRLLTGRTVLVTGAGGSIGSELARQIAAFEPGLLVLLDAGEFALYRISEEFAARFPATPVTFLVGDVRNGARIDAVMTQYRPQVVFHAAAYKHVPLMETGNAWEAVQNNVLGTLRVARAAVRHGVEKFVLISTDKAVNPTNVMGATKRLAEMACQSLQHQAATRFVIVRFGNVLGSNGSVIPKFHEQIAMGGPVTVTHPEVTRFFMSIPEAAQLVLQGGLMGQGGEVFVLDMGASVKIADLARDMIRLSGFTEDDIKIVYTGLRPGEKLFEELLADDEHTLPTPHPKLRIAKARSVDADWLDQLVAWLGHERTRSDAEVRRDLRRWVPEYAPTVEREIHPVPARRA